MLNGDAMITAKKKSIVYVETKKQLCTSSAVFFVNFFAVVLHNHNVKRSSYYTHLTKTKAYTLTDFGA